MVIPHLFWKRKIPDKVPAGVQKIIDQLKKTKSKEACLKKAYNILTKKYRGRRWFTYLKFFDLFKCTVKSIWFRRGFLHCTNFNYLLRVVLIKSGWFKDKDIEPKIMFINFYAIHQYFRINVGKKKIDVDLWSKAYGYKLGTHI